eukprot:g69059.t1
MATEQIHQEQLVRAELFNGRAAMLGFVIGVATEAITGQGILHQIGLGALTSHGVMPASEGLTNKYPNQTAASNQCRVKSFKF